MPSLMSGTDAPKVEAAGSIESSSLCLPAAGATAVLPSRGCSSKPRAALARQPHLPAPGSEIFQTPELCSLYMTQCRVFC